MAEKKAHRRTEAEIAVLVDKIKDRVAKGERYTVVCRELNLAPQTYISKAGVRVNAGKGSDALKLIGDAKAILTQLAKVIKKDSNELASVREKIQKVFG